MTRNDSRANGRAGARGPSRRTFLKAAATTGAMAAVGTGAAQEAETIELEAYIGGWEGVSPPEIEGETNPTLDLEVGRTYRVEWTAMDSFAHNFAVLNAEGDQVVRSEVIQGQGESQTVEFEATEEMAEYFCEVHPATMRGDIGIAETEARREVPEGPSVGLQRVAEGLNAPLGFETAPDGRRFVVDQTGQVYELTDAGLADEPFLDVSDRMVDLGIPELRGYDERGLLGLAFHPDFEENGRLFVRYSAPLRDEAIPEGAGPVETGQVDGGEMTDPEEALGNETMDDGTAGNETAGNATTGNETADDEVTKGGEVEPGYDHTDVLAEFEVAGDGSTVDPDSERAIWQIPSPQDNHNGGAIAFGQDGYLYTSIGDGGDADDTGFGHVDDWYDANEGGNGQDTEASLLGGVHRIDVDVEAGPDGRPYGIPEDNPFADGEDGFPEYYAWGFRNPWRMSFDSEGRLFVGDAGQNRFEEVDLVERGGNYGWNVREGTHCFSTENPSAPPEEVGDCPTGTPDDVRGGEPLLDPIIEFSHRFYTTAFIDGSVVIGGYVYDGDAIPELQGQYVFGNWSGEGVVDPDGQIFVASEPGADGGATAGGDAADADETGGNATDDGTGDDGTTDGTVAGEADDRLLWSFEEAVVEGSENDTLNRYVYGFGRDDEGELYVLTNLTFRPEGETGEVFRIVPAEEGENLPEPEPAEEVQQIADETETNETDAAAGNETAGNESAGD